MEPDRTEGLSAHYLFCMMLVRDLEIFVDNFHLTISNDKIGTELPGNNRRLVRYFSYTIMH